MTSEEKKILRSAVVTIADPNGNWHLGWRQLCELAEIDPAVCKAPFKEHPFYNPDEQKAG